LKDDQRKREKKNKNKEPIVKKSLDYLNTVSQIKKDIEEITDRKIV